MNHHALGVCLVGNFDSAPPPPAQLEILRDRCLIPWMRMFQIPPQNVRFHRDFAGDRTCPGKAFTRDVLAPYLPGGIV
jgi:hypothetical protein